MTKYQVNHLTSADEITKTINEINVKYKTVNFGDKKVIKIGYCCDEVGVLFPIYVKFNTNDDIIEIKLSKNGMYEVQAEDILKDKDNPPLWITEAYLPYAYEDSIWKTFGFTFDYYA